MKLIGLTIVTVTLGLYCAGAHVEQLAGEAEDLKKQLAGKEEVLERVEHGRGGRGARGAAGRRGRGFVQQTSNQEAGRGAGKAYTGQGARFWNLMFGPDSESFYVQAEEEPVTQNAPSEEWIDDF